MSRKKGFCSICNAPAHVNLNTCGEDKCKVEYGQRHDQNYKVPQYLERLRAKSVRVR